jgi:protein O-GlcNAc transferase
MPKKSAKKLKKTQKTANQKNNPATQTISIQKAIQLARQYHQAGDLQKAETLYRQILQLQPNHADALHLLGVIAAQIANYEQAINLFKRAIQINDSVATYYANLGNAQDRIGQLSEAVNSLQRAVALNPNYAQAHDNLGKVLKQQGQIHEAIIHFQRAIALKPNYVEAHNNLGNVFRELIKFDEALKCYQQALALNPNYVQAHINLGNLFKDTGKIPEAITHYFKALALNPNDTISHTNLLYALNLATDHDRTRIFYEHQRFNEQQAKPLAISIAPHFNESTSTRKLKIGYVSGDFREHPVAYFMEPILAHHNHQQFEIFCYHNHHIHDNVTKRLQQYTDHWMDCIGLSDEKLAEQIRQDQIDILVDLAGHTAFNRLLVFAQKPAPVQVTYLGYPNTTGLNTIDYRVTDHYRDKEGSADSFSSETLERMPNSYFCYRPYNDSPLVNELPALKNSYVTFGSFNNFAKLNPDMIALWAKILVKIKNSKCLLKTKSLHDNQLQHTLTEKFVRLGVKPEQLILEGSTPVPAYLTRYHQVDIGLDSFPYNGGTTTCEALWMGVPVVTLVGETHVSRMGLSILSTVELTELVAHTQEEYVEICVKLANDIEYLQTLRTGMRERMQNSPLMDGVGFTRDLEKAYRKMWEKWCAQN